MVNSFRLDKKAFTKSVEKSKTCKPTKKYVESKITYLFFYINYHNGVARPPDYHDNFES